MSYKKLLVGVLSVAISSWVVAADFKAGEDYILTGVNTSGSTEKVQVTEFFGYWCPHCNNFEPLLENWLSENTDKVEFDRVPVAFSSRGQNQTLAQKAYFIGKQTKNTESVDATMFDFYHKYGRIAPSFKDLDKIKSDPVACNVEINALVDSAAKKSQSSGRPFDVTSVTKYLNDNVCQTDARGWALLKLGQQARGSIRNADVLEEILKAAGVDTANFSQRLDSFSMTSELKNAARKMKDMGIDSVPTIVVNDKYRVTSTKGFEHMLQVVEYLIEKEQSVK